MKYEIGSPCMMGCNIVNGGYNFAYASSYAAMHSDTAVYVCIFKRNDTEPFYELELHKTMGIVYSIFITGINIDDCFYCFKENEEYIVDPYAKAVTECEIFGIENGFNGLVTGRMGLMDYKDVSGILPRGGTILGTTNRDNPFKFAVEENGELVYYDKRAEVLANLEKHGIEALVVIGGDGSLNIAARLAKECGIKVVGVPKTIDNDLPCTERTFGFDTAMAMATEALDRIHTTAESHHRVMALEVMGRYAGWIALHSGIAGGADVILIPEDRKRVV